MFKKNTWILYVCLILSVGFSFASRVSSLDSFAVVELFTSEGCSSCPPADELIAKIQKEYKNRPVYILAYHVDYWDRLGWKDRFSDVKFSRRQHQYAHWLNLSSVYTPQIVVNGKQEFVGSDEKILRNSLENALSKTSSSHLQISFKKHTADNIILSYNTNEQTKGENLVIALVKPYAKNKINSGENQGRTLNHVQIVTYLESYNIGDKMVGDVNLESPNIKTDYDIIAYLQNTLTGRITSATKISL